MKNPGATRLRNLQTKIAIKESELRLRRLEAMSSLGGGGDSGYIAPGSSRRSMRGWSARARSADADILPKLDKIRGGSRDLAMNTPIALGAIRRVVTNAIGWGLTLQASVDKELLGLSPEQANAWQRETERQWRNWAYSPEADAGRTMNFQTMQSVAMFNMLLSGDCFILMPYINRPGFPYRLKLRLLESDYVCNPDSKPETSSFAGGIEYDEFGAPVRYHIKKIPLAASIGMESSSTFEPVEAFGKNSGRRNILHLMRPERIGQRRGLPFLAPVVERLKQISRLSEAELSAAVIASYFAVFIKGPTGVSDSLLPEERAVSESEAKAKNMVELAPGLVAELGEGQTGIEVADPKRPNGAFEPFFLAMVKEIGAGICIPFEVLIQHFSASYTAARGAFLEAWKTYLDHRHFFIENLTDPVYEAWMDERVSAGAIDAPGYFDDYQIRQAWLGCRWTGRGQGMIDPVKETSAALAKIGGLLSSYEAEVAAASGENWEMLLAQRAREEALKKEQGVSAAAPAAAPTEPDEEDPKDDPDIPTGAPAPAED